MIIRGGSQVGGGQQSLGCCIPAVAARGEGACGSVSGLHGMLPIPLQLVNSGQATFGHGQATRIM